MFVLHIHTYYLEKYCYLHFNTLFVANFSALNQLKYKKNTSVEIVIISIFSRKKKKIEKT